jgi:general secretion pathway protein I
MRHDAGFTLLEVMAAFVIAALATVVVLRAGFTGAVQSRVAGTYEQAVARAQSRLASFGTLTALQAETLSGDDGGGYAWRVVIAPLQTTGTVTLYRIDLTESFGTRAVQLTTERLAVGQ